MNRRIAVFLSASFTIDEKFNAVVRELARAASLHNCIVVSGGTVKGSMKVLCDELSSVGGYSVGVIPRFMEGLRHPSLNEFHLVDTMSERKEKMREGTDAVIALPGGIGTLDEFIETLVLHKLNRYAGKVILLNSYGFYDPLIGLLKYYVETGMLEEDVLDSLLVASDVEEAMNMI